MNHSLSYWADVVAEIATRRGRKWQDRLGRRIEYPLSALRVVAEDIHKSQAVLTDEGVLQTAEQAFIRMEMPLQMEWAARQHGVGRA